MLCGCGRYEGVQKDNRNLDLLRAAAVMLVLVSHLIMALGYLDHPFLKEWAIRDLAMMGVLMFFIHTSLVLMMSLDRLGDHNIVRRFYVRRAFRIYPLAIVTIAAALALKIPPHFEPVYEPPSWAAILENALLVQNLFQTPAIVGPMWSLPLEVQMYLMLPFIYFAARKVQSYIGIIALVLSGFVVWYAELRISRALDYLPLLRFAPWFFMGIAAYAGYRIVKPCIPAAYFVFTLFLLMLTPSLVVRFIGGHRAGWAIWGAGVLFALALPYFRDIANETTRNGAHIIAKYSYGIYLAHVPIMWFAFQRLSTEAVWLQVTIFVVLMPLVPVLFYHLVEAPFIRIGARIADSLSTSAPSFASSAGTRTFR